MVSTQQSQRLHAVACVQLEILVPLENLLEHESIRVQTYANASLYTLLREPAIRSVSRPAPSAPHVL